jgi:hypothetical protein
MSDTRETDVKISRLDDNTVIVTTTEYEPCYDPAPCKWCEQGFKRVKRVGKR